MNESTFAIDELSFPEYAEGRLATNQESGNRLGNMANISDCAEIFHSRVGALGTPLVSYKKSRAASRHRRIRIGSAE